jgi:hypothetical protein
MMTWFRWQTGLCLAMVVAIAAPNVQAQRGRNPPDIGYVFPAGGRQGEAFEVIVGGQYLKDTAEVNISGDGVQVELLDYVAPLRGKAMTTLREVFRQAQKKVREEAKKGPRPGRRVIRQMFLKMAKEKGITDKQIEAFNRYRKQRNDPKRQLNPQLTEWVKLRITLDASARLGSRELRVATKLGLSNPLQFHVGHLPEFRESEPNDKTAVATEVPSLPVVLNGQIMPGDVDRFRFNALKGQRLVMDVSARDLIPYLADAVPGWFQAIVTLYDADGREVACADDYRFDPDPVLRYEVPRDGQYVLEIRDAIYRGREDFVYRIALGELPFVSSIFPLGGPRGKRTAVAVEGWNLSKAQRRQKVSHDTTGIHSLRIEGSAGVSNAVPFAVDDLPEHREKEQNGDTAHAEKLTMPVIVNGRIEQPGDQDVFRFHARKGDEIVAEVHARRLGSPLDSLLRMTDARGRQMALSDDHRDEGAGLVTHHADSLLTVSIPTTGHYLLWLGDTQRKGGPEYGYRLRVSRKQEDFALRVMPSAISVRGNTTVPITVYALRKDGFTGDIRLRLVGAPEGFLLAGALVQAGQDKVRLTMEVPRKTEQKLTHLFLEGVAHVDGKDVSRRAVAADDVMQAFLYRHLVPAENWTIAVQPVRWKSPPWIIADGATVQLKSEGTTLVSVRSRRRLPKGKVFLKLSDPPEGIRIEKLTRVKGGFDFVLHADADKATVGLKGNLIIDISAEHQPPKKEDKPLPPVRRWSMGVLPAVPFEIVGG